MIAFARSHGPKLAQYCLNEALPLQPSELNEHANDPEDYALHADDGWEIEAAYDDDIYEEEAYDADSTDAPDGCRAVRAAAERCLLSLLAVDRTGDSALSRMLVERAFGDDRRAAVEQAVGALAYVVERHCRTMQSLLRRGRRFVTSRRHVGRVSHGCAARRRPSCWFAVRELLSLFTDQAAERGHF